MDTVEFIDFEQLLQTNAHHKYLTYLNKYIYLSLFMYDNSKLELSKRNQF